MIHIRHDMYLFNIFNIDAYLMKGTLTFQHVERDEQPNKNKHTLTMD